MTPSTGQVSHPSQSGEALKTIFLRPSLDVIQFSNGLYALGVKIGKRLFDFLVPGLHDSGLQKKIYFGYEAIPEKGEVWTIGLHLIDPVSSVHLVALEKQNEAIWIKFLDFVARGQESQILIIAAGRSLNYEGEKKLIKPNETSELNYQFLDCRWFDGPQGRLLIPNWELVR